MLGGVAAAAAAPLPPGAWLVPGDRAWHTASSWPQATPQEMFDFTVYAYYENGEYATIPYDVEVATAPALDPDGTLRNANRIDAYVATLLPTHPGVFAARTRLAAPWLGAPGTYYWQAH